MCIRWLGLHSDVPVAICHQSLWCKNQTLEFSSFLLLWMQVGWSTTCCSRTWNLRFFFCQVFFFLSFDKPTCWLAEMYSLPIKESSCFSLSQQEVRTDSSGFQGAGWSGIKTAWNYEPTLKGIMHFHAVISLVYPEKTQSRGWFCSSSSCSGSEEIISTDIFPFFDYQQRLRIDSLFCVFFLVQSSFSAEELS